MNDGIVLGTFAGPGGWAVAAAALGIPEVGIELDAAACRTRAAAGHKTIRADVATVPLDRLPGKVWGHVSSPPCTTFSAAGKRAGGVRAKEAVFAQNMKRIAQRKTSRVSRRGSRR